jgi:pimeloyl-ACP methyl ester carboxylesterase
VDLATAPVRTVQLTAGTIRYRDVGSGPTLLFVHGVFVDGMLWRDTVAQLAGTHRCVVPDLPLGAHELPARPGADLSPPGLADLVAELIAALDLPDVVLVGNDTGGTVCQLVVARHPARLAGLVLTNTEAFEHFPLVAQPFRLGGSRLGSAAVARLMRLRPAQRLLMALVSRRPFDAALAGRWLGHAGRPGIREDLRTVLGSLGPRHTIAAARSFGAFDRPVLLVWGTGDRLVFPMRSAERLAAAFRDSRLVRVPGARAFLPVDAPEELAAAVADFTRERRTV